ncbi:MULTISPECIES: SoxR reducing system RseC family protein [Clostridium]|uniref:Positive regulator of sigma(E), RseC/MucC n=2 Tax=Clostridium TaxID=1485 RepID=A0A151ALM3_9CLOT|nr:MULTISPECIES: SoxR reducing system RseC family protein [Clostridium]KYH28534.1 positive regulator of sigma(E), RseC/MucC [Clostridium colicanis DSM 13634]MBE6042826.1 sigma-E factor regulator, RseC/MucC family protein [Clostridium thermopalmarium]PRR69839.1 Positive regulator of sigma(E), RseC/MucC [Clostridium thermopalmarium DSM 5974]PVZ21596.1 RseC/MucC-like positive regulator of sigma(E) [Clostridium thermopalmarium DSM 5974]
MVQTGYVTSIQGEYAVVSFKRQGGCGDSCASCKLACASAGVTTEIKNTLGAKIGDKVKVEMKQNAFNKMLLWVYVFPLIMLAIGIGVGMKVFATLGYGNVEILSFLLGIVALGISYWILSKISKKTAQKEEYSLRMTQIVK